MNTLRATIFATCLFTAVGCAVASDRFGDDAGAPTPTSDGGTGPFTLTVDPSADSETVVIASGKNVTFHATRHDSPSDVGTDVSSLATWTVDQGPIASSTGAGLIALHGVGGTVTVHASLDGVSAEATLVVKATGPLFGSGTSASTASAFQNAPVDPNAADAPALEYPNDGVILPGNLPAIEMQWTQTADNDVYDLHMTAASLDIDAYFTSRGVTLPSNVWTAILQSTFDAPVTWSVKAMGPSQQVRLTGNRTFTPTADTIDQTSIYVWQSSTQTFHVIDIAAGTDVQLPATSTAFGTGCVGCHRISRDGTRMAFAHIPSTGAPIELATLQYDSDAGSFSQEVAASSSNLGSYSAFNPLESSQVPALLATREDGVARDAPGNIRLELTNPDTNATVPSNLSTMLSSLDAHNPGRGTLMPDWSPDGSFVVFAAYDNVDHVVRCLGEDIELGSIVESSVSYSNGTFTFGAPNVLVGANPSDTAETGTNNLLPAISPDGSVVAFTRVAGYYPLDPIPNLENLSGQVMMVRRTDQQVIALANGTNGSGQKLDSTWPQWAPTLGKHYAWLAYGSERDYGHELTVANHSCGDEVQGQTSCKQIWVTAVDLTKMASGTSDPSAPPFWVPGQSINAQYVSPQWTKAVVLNPN